MFAHTHACLFLLYILFQTETGIVVVAADDFQNYLSTNAVNKITEVCFFSVFCIFFNLYYGPGRGGPVSRIDFTKTSVSPVSPLKNRQSIGDTDSLGGLKVSILRPQSIDFSGAVSRIDFKKSAVSSIANIPLPGPYLLKGY